MATHEFSSRLVWTGNRGTGTADYSGYDRAHDIVIGGKPVLAGSAAAAFRGDASRHNPEDLFLSSIAACHMLFYLSLCARAGVVVVAYEDRPRGTLAIEPGGAGRFTDITLAPEVTITDRSQESLARELHDAAHERCFIAGSCSVPIRHAATIGVAQSGAA